MRIQPLTAKTHEGAVKQLRIERHAEDRRLETLKAKLNEALSPKQNPLFAAHPNGQVNAA